MLDPSISGRDPKLTLRRVWNLRTLHVDFDMESGYSLAIIESEFATCRWRHLLSKIEPNRNNLARGSPRQYSFGKIAVIFLIIGPPTFAPLFYLVGDIATRNGDTIHTKIGEAFGMVLSLYGLS